MSEWSPEQVQGILEETVEDFPHAACLTCECFLGLVAHFGISKDPAVRFLLQTYQVPRKEMHACLGCDPCPPGDHYAKYIHDKQGGKIITL